MIPGLTPADLGLPEKFKGFRSGQNLALKRGMESEKRFVAHSMPVGEGKSLYYIVQALLSAERALVLTSSKGLQTQLSGDFSAVGLVDMRGRNNYTCSNKEARTCEEGQHYRCEACPYEQARLRMMASPLVVTNYSYYMLSNIHGRGMGNFDLLILDEVHGADGEVCKAIAVEVTYRDASKMGTSLPKSEDMDDWKTWANNAYHICSVKLQELEDERGGDVESRGKVHPQTRREIHTWKTLQGKASSVMGAMGEWVVSKTGEGYRLEPVWARDYAQSTLFRQIPKVVMVSATMVRKTLDLLGVKDEECDYFEYASSFPKERSPVYMFGAGRIDHKSDAGSLDVWVSKIDNIIRRRTDRKGIIHSVSYDRARFIKDRSAFSSFMVAPENGRDTAKCIEQFENSPAPSILISPAITTGYDFKGDIAEYNIIAKVPFLDSRDKVISVRSKEDPEYAAYVTAQTIVQALGRTMRAEWDQSENFIVDSHFNWFIRKHHRLFPFWFHRLVSKPSGMPEPPAPLSKGAGNHQPSNK